MKPDLCAFAVFLLSFPLAAQIPSSRIGVELARLADRDRSGEVSEDEWRTFVAEVTGTGDSKRALKIRLFAARLDRDGNGTVEKADLEAIFTAYDRNGDGTLSAEEISGSRRAGDLLATRLNGVLVRSADADASGDVTAEEWKRFLGSNLVRGSIEVRGLIQRLLDAEPSKAEERAIREQPGARTWRVFLATIDSSIDVDHNGAVERDDLAAIFASLDRNRDKVLQAAELRGRGAARVGRSGRAGGRRRGGFGRYRNPTAEQRAKPCLVRWQRNLTDALALVAATGKPLLICVNMDGEPASEQLAWIRYRDPAFAQLTEKFISVIASPNRRNRRDYDDRGRRIPDRRFGRVTNAEHIDIEPALFERYFRGQRLAPRHLGVSPKGEILFDIYLTPGLEPVDAALEKYGSTAGRLPEPDTLGEGELLASPEGGHRDELERRFLAADGAARARLAALALSDVRSVQHPEIVRLALRDPSAAVRRAAVQAVAGHSAKVPLDTWVTAFRVAQGDVARTKALLDGLARRVEATDDASARKNAQQLLVFQRGLQGESKWLDRVRWELAVRAAPRAGRARLVADELERLDELLDDLEKAIPRRQSDPELSTLLAATTMHYARIRLAQGQDPSFLLEDVKTAAGRATSAEHPNGKALAYLAWASWLLNDRANALRHAEAALPISTWFAGSELAFEVLNVFVKARTQVLYEAMNGGQETPRSWISDVVVAHEILLAHSLAGEEQYLAYLDFLDVVRGYGRQHEVITRALARFPVSSKLHEHLRRIVLRDRGAQALEDAYAGLEVDPANRPTLDWFQGLATLMAAERHVENRQAGAAAAYRRSVEKFRASLEASPSFASSANHYICLALSGCARLHADAAEWRAAVDALAQGLTASAGSKDTKDGLGNTPAENARHVYRGLVAAGRQNEADALRHTLSELGVTVGS